MQAFEVLSNPQQCRQYVDELKGAQDDSSPPPTPRSQSSSQAGPGPSSAYQSAWDEPFDSPKAGHTYSWPCSYGDRCKLALTPSCPADQTPCMLWTFAGRPDVVIVDPHRLALHLHARMSLSHPHSSSPSSLTWADRCLPLHACTPGVQHVGLCPQMLICRCTVPRSCPPKRERCAGPTSTKSSSRAGTGQRRGIAGAVM